MSDTSRPVGPTDDEAAETVTPAPVESVVVPENAAEFASPAPATAEEAAAASYAPPTLVEPEPVAVESDRLPTGEIPAEAMPVTTPVAAEPVASAPLVEGPVVGEPTTPVVPVTAEPVTAEPVAAVPLAATPSGLPPVAPDNRVVYVDAPQPPRKRGNRGFGFLFVIIGTIIFAALYALAGAVIIGLASPGEFFGGRFNGFVTSSAFYVPVAFFFVFYLLLVLIVNRGGWWAYIIGSIIVGVITYFGSIGVFLLQEHVTALSPAQAGILFGATAINPFVIVAALLAREVTLWTGAAIAARGRRVKVRNVEAREAFDREQEEEKARRDAAYAPQY